MRSLVLILTLIGALLLSPTASRPADAQPCDQYPSSECPARGVSRSMAHFPCLAGQIKGDWNTMLYRTPRHASYASTGLGPNADIWCFDDEYQAEGYGFRNASY
jgi:hypothetical protein